VLFQNSCCVILKKQRIIFNKMKQESRSLFSTGDGFYYSVLGHVVMCDFQLKILCG